MGSPCRVGVVPDLDQNKDFLRTFPIGWCLAFAMGSPISGWVALSAHSIGTKAFSVHLSLVASRWGHPAGRVCFFRTLDRNEAYFG